MGDGRHNSDSFSDEENDGMARGEQKDVNEKRWSPVAAKSNRRNLNQSQVLNEISIKMMLGGQDDNTSRSENEDEDEDEDHVSAAIERQDNCRHKPRPAQLKDLCEVAEGGMGRVPLYAKGAEVGYRSGSSALQAAIIVGVHKDDLLEPYYTIRMQEDGREKQTDNAHLVLGPWLRLCCALAEMKLKV